MKNEYKVIDEEVHIILRRKDGTKVTAIVDRGDLEKVDSFSGTWSVQTSHTPGVYYSSIHRSGSVNKRTQLMHRFLMGVDNPRDVVDHINGNGLDNRRSNLRVTTQAQNSQNRNRMNKNNKSGVRGVSWDRRMGKWVAGIKVNRRRIVLGYFKCIENAEFAVTEARRIYMTHSAENMVKTTKI